MISKLPRTDRCVRKAVKSQVASLASLRLSIIKSTAGFFDETGIKVRGIGHWVHVAATSVFSFFHFTPSEVAKPTTAWAFLLFLEVFYIATIIIPT